MVQEFWAVRCHACGAFQCTQVRAASRHHAARSGCLRRRSLSGVAVLLHHGACATALVLSLTPARALGTLSAVHVQAKKSMGFTCVVCGEKTRRVRAVLMASNDARDCRRYVQMRNAGAGEEQEALGEAKALAEVEARAGWEDDLAEADQYDQCPDGDYDAADTFGVGAGGTLEALERAEELNKEQRGEYERARERDSRGSGGSDGGFQHASSAVGFQFAGREALPKAPRKGTWDAFLDGKGDVSDARAGIPAAGCSGRAWGGSRNAPKQPTRQPSQSPGVPATKENAPPRPSPWPQWPTAPAAQQQQQQQQQQWRWTQLSAAPKASTPKAPAPATRGVLQAQPQPQPPPVAAPKEDDVWDELLE